MSETITVKDKVTVVQEVDVTAVRMIQEVYVNLSDRVFWKIETRRQDDNKVLRIEWFNCNASELSDFVNEKRISYEDLWEKTAEILELPMTNPEEIRIKTQKTFPKFIVTIV